jgi:hypothetical protein
MKFSFGQIVRIVGVATALLALIVLQRPCSKSVSKFVTSFGEPDAAVRLLDAGVDAGGVMLRGDMTPAEREALIKREIEAAQDRDAGTPGDAGTAPDAPATPRDAGRR